MRCATFTNACSKCLRICFALRFRRSKYWRALLVPALLIPVCDGAPIELALFPGDVCGSLRPPGVWEVPPEVRLLDALGYGSTGDAVGEVVDTYPSKVWPLAEEPASAAAAMVVLEAQVVGGEAECVSGGLTGEPRVGKGLGGGRSGQDPGGWWKGPREEPDPGGGRTV